MFANLGINDTAFLARTIFVLNNNNNRMPIGRKFRFIGRESSTEEACWEWAGRHAIEGQGMCSASKIHTREREKVCAGERKREEGGVHGEEVAKGKGGETGDSCQQVQRGRWLFSAGHRQKLPG